MARLGLRLGFASRRKPGGSGKPGLGCRGAYPRFVQAFCERSLDAEQPEAHGMTGKNLYGPSQAYKTHSSFPMPRADTWAKHGSCSIELECSVAEPQPQLESMRP